MSSPSPSPSAASPGRRFQRDDTIPDAKFFDLTIATPLVIAAQTTEDITPVQEDELVDSTTESRAEFPGPHKWEDSLGYELKNEADRILRTFTKTPVDGEFDPALPPVAPVEDNLADRLGRGYLDASSLTLLTEESGVAQLTTSVRRSLGATQFARLTSRKGLHSRSASRAREERRRQELRDRVLPYSANFSPEFYLSHVHAETALTELQDGMRFLEVELSKRTGQLKTLVKEHFEGFISCKNTIDDVHVRLRRNEAQNSGANTASLKASLAHVQSELSNTYAPILERHGKLEQLRQVMEMLKRFQSFFNLPSNIRQLSQNRDYQQVISEYRRAKSIMTGTERSIWRLLFEEVKKETTDVCMKMNSSLEDPSLDADQVQELTTCLYQLRKEGLECTFTLEPLQLWLMQVEDFLYREMDKLLARHERQVELIDHSQEKARRRLLTGPIEADFSTMGQPSCVNSMSEQCTQYMTRLCRLLVDHLPKLWKLRSHPQLLEMPEIDLTIQNDVLKELENVDDITQGVMKAFVRKIVQIMEGMLMSEGLLSPAVFVLLKELRLFTADMKVNASPETLRDLVHECFEMCVNYLCTFLRQQMASLGEWEDWKIRIGSYCRGHPVTSVPYRLGQEVRGVMEQFRQIKAEQDQWTDGSIEVEAKSLNHAFNECFESFAMAVEGLAAEILGPNEPTVPHNPQLPEISKLLILISNSMYIRQRILPELTAKYSDFIQGSEEDGSLLKQFETLEDTMVQTYVDHAKKIIEKAVDATIALEKEAPPLKLMEFRASEAPAEWVSLVADFHAELLKYAPAKSEAVLSAIILHLVKRMKLRIQDLPHLGFLLQIYIDVMFVDTVFKGVDVKEVHKAWDAIYERLNQLISTQIHAMRDMDKDMDYPEEDTGMNVLNVFSDSDLEDVMKLDKRLQRTFKEGVKESVKSMSINLASMRTFKAKERTKGGHT